MIKGREIFLDHFARLGIFIKVRDLAGPMSEEIEGAKSKDDKVRE